MSNERMDALTVREDKNGKAWFTKVGSAFPTRDGLGYSVLLDAMPASVDGQYKIILTVPKPKDNDRPSGGNTGGGRKSDPDSDGIPFSPQVA